MLTILNDPHGITGRRSVELDRSVTLQQNIERHLSGGADAELRINGQRVDPLTDPRLDRPPGRFDVVTISLRPRGDPATWVYIVSAVLSVVSYIAARSISYGDTSTTANESPNNKLTQQTNTARAYQAVPDVYGFRRVWPDLIQPSTVEYIDQVKFVTEWLCVSRGLGTITEVQYAETPIGDVDGSSFEVFEPVAPDGVYPELGTTTLGDVYEAFASDEVNGQELPYATNFPPFTRSGTFSAVAAATSFTLTIPDDAVLDPLKSLAPTGTASVLFSYAGGTESFNQPCTVLGYSIAGGNATFTFSSSPWATTESDAASFTIAPLGATPVTVGPFTLPLDATQIWFNTVFLRGLVGSVTVRAEWWQVDADGVEVGGTREHQDVAFTAGTYDQRFYTTKLTPAAGAGRYRIQFQRRTVQVDANGADVAKLEEVYAVRYFPTKTLAGVTVLRVTTKATLSATGFSDRKFNLRWARHVRTLDTDDLSPSRNFTRAMAHVWTIAGNPMSGLDVDALQAINDEHGEDAPLLRFDGSFDDADMSLGERLQFIADTARCGFWRDGTRWTVTRDQAQAHPVIQLDYRNLAANGESTLSEAAFLPASNDGIEIEYVDEQTQAKKAYARRRILNGDVLASAARNPKKLQMLGCTTRQQAENRADLEVRRLLYQRTTVTDTALGDAQDLGLGSLVRWVDPNDFGGDGLQAGEVMAIDGDVITTSEPLDFKGESTGRILFTGVDGRRVGAPVICHALGEQVIQLADVPAGLFVRDAERQCGSRYAFAVGLTEAEIESQALFVTTDLKPQTDGTVSIALAAYDSRMYAGDS